MLRQFLIYFIAMFSCSSSAAEIELLHVFNGHSLGPVNLTLGGPALAFSQGYLQGEVKLLSTKDSTYVFRGPEASDRNSYSDRRICPGHAHNLGGYNVESCKIELMVGSKKLIGFYVLGKDEIAFGSHDCATDGFVLTLGNRKFDSTQGCTQFLSKFFNLGEGKTPLKFEFNQLHDEWPNLIQYVGLTIADSLESELKKASRRQIGQAFIHEHNHEPEELMEREDYERLFMVTYDNKNDDLHFFAYRYFPEGYLLCDVHATDDVFMKVIMKGMVVHLVPYGEINKSSSFLNGAVKFNFSEDFRRERSMPTFIFRVKK